MKRNVTKIVVGQTINTEVRAESGVYISGGLFFMPWVVSRGWRVERSTAWYQHRQLLL